MRTIIVPTLLIALLGCRQADESLAQREAFLGERQAIERYASAAEGTWELQNIWISHSAGAVGLKTADDIGRAYADKVAPALAAYRDALEAMPVASEGLRDIHREMVAAHSRLLEAYRAFAKDLSGENYPERIKVLREATTGFHAAQRRYVERLQKHYGAHGVELLPDPPVRLVALDKPAG